MVVGRLIPTDGNHLSGSDHWLLLTRAALCRSPVGFFLCENDSREKWLRAILSREAVGLLTLYHVFSNVPLRKWMGAGSKRALFKYCVEGHEAQTVIWSGVQE